MNIRKFLTLDRLVFLIALLLAAAVIGINRQIVWLRLITIVFDVLPYIFCPAIIMVFCTGAYLGLLIVWVISRTYRIIPHFVLLAGIIIAFLSLTSR